MFRLARLIAFMALAFYAGIQFERAEAGDACAGEADWSPYLTCVAREVLNEIIS
ncbi:MAG: hypothetical protein AAGH73_11695 [Pseudomonadota bacterium]